jgi:hypothetical protein
MPAPGDSNEAELRRAFKRAETALERFRRNSETVPKSLDVPHPTASIGTSDRLVITASTGGSDQVASGRPASQNTAGDRTPDQEAVVPAEGDRVQASARTVMILLGIVLMLAVVVVPRWLNKRGRRAV